MIDRLPTGIDSLDRLLDGGIPSGSLVKLAAPPNSQAEMLLREMTTARQTIYFTTLRPESAVRDTLEAAGVQLSGVAVQELGRTTAMGRRHDAQPMMVEALDLLENIPPETNVIVDPIDVFEWAGTEDYLTFLNELASVISRTDSIGVVHCLDGHDIPDQRDVTDYVSDIAFHLSTEITEDGIDTRLSVPKFRGRTAPQETVKLDLNGGISIDLSRNIA